MIWYLTSSQKNQKIDIIIKMINYKKQIIYKFTNLLTKINLIKIKF